MILLWFFWSLMTVILSGTVLLYFILNHSSDRYNTQEETETFQANRNIYNKQNLLSVFLWLCQCGYIFMVIFLSWMWGNGVLKKMLYSEKCSYEANVQNSWLSFTYWLDILHNNISQLITFHYTYIMGLRSIIYSHDHIILHSNAIIIWSAVVCILSNWEKMCVFFFTKMTNIWK